MTKRTSILIIYTGGTIGMVQDPATKALKPFDFNSLKESLPGLEHFNLDIGIHAFDRVIDSSDMNPQYWQQIAEVIEYNYNNYDGFVILHGTDTMSYTASALSFMLENLAKPVILTGSQLPLGVLRSDGKDNIITSIEIAAAKNDDGSTVVPEVCICFENTLYRGNRTTKSNAEDFNAFTSGNYPSLAEIGVHIKYNTNAIMRVDRKKPLKIYKNFDSRVMIFKIFPGMSREVVESILSIPDLQGLILETYGAGNAPSVEWFYDALKKASDKGVIIMNVTQCHAGAVEMGKYEASVALANTGVISGSDITTESAVAKMMWLLSCNISKEDIKQRLATAARGEMVNV